MFLIHRYALHRRVCQIVLDTVEYTLQLQCKGKERGRVESVYRLLSSGNTVHGSYVVSQSYKPRFESADANLNKRILLNRYVRVGHRAAANVRRA